MQLKKKTSNQASASVQKELRQRYTSQFCILRGKAGGGGGMCAGTMNIMLVSQGMGF